MSRGRHTHPRAKGGGLSAFLAVAVAGGAVALASTQPNARVLRLCVVGVALISSFQLLILTRTQRFASRALVRTEDRLRALEQRNRDEGDELHRRVLDGVAREGELRRAVEELVDEIGRLRRSLEAFVTVAPATVEPVAPTVYAAAPAPAEPAAESALALDIPLIQRVFAVQEEAAPQVVAAAPPPAPVPTPLPVPIPVPLPAVMPLAVPAHAAAHAAPSQEPAPGDLWRAPARPEYVPAHSRAAKPIDVPVRSWVVRELQLEQPGAAVTMRILDLTSARDETPAEDLEPTSTWSAFARPA
jgi:hypothetical protein